MISSVGKDVVKATFEEIAFEGAPGISWSSLCARLRDRDFIVDSLLRAKLWEQCIARKSEIIFRDAHGKELHEVMQDAPVEDDEMRDEAPQGELKRLRRGMRKKLRLAAPSGKDVLLDVSTELRHRLLHIAPHPELIDNSTIMKAFQAISRARSQGAWAVLLALDLGIIPRDIFYQLEGLRLAGLVISINANMPREVLKEYNERAQPNPAAQQACHSNLLFHARFYNAAKLESAHVQMLIKNAEQPLSDRMLQAISESKSKVVFEGDLRGIANEVLLEQISVPVSGRTAGRLYQKVRKQLHEQQKVEFVRVWDACARVVRDGLCEFGAHPPEALAETTLALEDDPDASMKATVSGIGGTSEALDSCNSESPYEEGEEDDEWEREKQPYIPVGTRAGIVNDSELASVLVSERPLFVQTVDIIACSGAVGLTSPEIADLLNLQRKSVERLLNDLIKTRRVVKIMESDGKMHVNRYLSKIHAPKMSSSSSVSRLGAFARSCWSKRGAANTGKTSEKVARFDSTFKRRIKRAVELVEEQHVLTALDFRRILQMDGGVESKYFMDRRTAQRVMEGASKIDKRFKTAHGYCLFAYWSPALSEKDAVLRVEEQYRQRKAERWQGSQDEKRKTQALAIADEPSSGSTALAPLVPDISALASSPNSRRLLTDITVTSIRRNNEQRGNQKIQTFYGYQAPVMVRVQLLHELLTQSFLDGRDWNAKQVVDEMEVQVFLQVVGCGAQNDYIDKLLRSGNCKPKLQSLPPNVYQTLMNTTYSPQRAQHVVRRLLAHLVKLRLVTTTSSSAAPEVLPVSIGNHSVPESSHQSVEKSKGDYGRYAPKFGGYRLCRHAELFSFSRSETDDPPKKMGSYDFAQPNAFTQYWKQLQELSEAWMAKSAKTCQNASGGIQSSRQHGNDEDQSEASDGATQLEHDKDDLAGPKSLSSALPINTKLTELFHKKNWKHKAWLTPDQRVAIVDFVHEIMAEATKKSMFPDPRTPPAECTTLALRCPPRVFTPRSPQIIALSRRIGVSPDRIIKHCKQISELEKTGLRDVAGEQHVVFTALCSVRYRCHICYHLCCQRNAIEEHYHNEHGTELPADESVYCDEDFHMHRLEQAKENRATNERRRRRRVRSRPNAGGSSSSGDAAPILPSHILPHEFQKPVKQRWGDAPGDETEWLRLLVVAELLVAQQQGEELTCQGDAVSAEVWPTLATLTGRSPGHCRRRIRKLLKNDKKNRRTVNVLRAKSFQPAVAKQGPIVGGALWAMARSVAKTLLLTPHRAHEPWWRSDIFAYNVNELVEWVFRQWQMERLVCKFKPTTHSERLPETSKPHYLLTWEARLRLFGRLNEVVRWYECLSQTQLAPQSDSKMLVTEANGSLVQLLSDLMANDEVSLTPVWQDTAFYENHISKDGETRASDCDVDNESLVLSKSEASNQDSQEDSDLEDAIMEELKEGSDDTEFRDDNHNERNSKREEMTHGKFGKYGGVRAHLKLTKDTPNIEGVSVVVGRDSQSLLKILPARKKMLTHDATTARFLEWIKLTTNELDNLASAESEPIDPILLEHVMLLSSTETQPEKASDKSDRSRMKLSAPKAQKSRVAESASQPLASPMEGTTAARKCAWGMPARSEHEASSDIDAFKEFASRLHTPPGIQDAAALLDVVAFLLKVILAHVSADGVRACSLSQLRERFRKQFDRAGEDEFLAAIACLEELRLVVPFACGPEFCEVLATDAAPFCFTRGPGQGKSSRTNDDIFSLCEGFTVGRHWRCNPQPSDAEWNLMTQAARTVAERAGAGTSKSSVVRLMLPRGLVAPAFMLEATTLVNSSVLRFLCLRFLIQVAKTPGASAAELALQSGILDECEAQLLLKAMCEVGALEASGVSSCSEASEACAFFLRPMSA